MLPVPASIGRSPAFADQHAARLASHGLASTSYAVARSSRCIATPATLARFGPLLWPGARSRPGTGLEDSVHARLPMLCLGCAACSLSQGRTQR